MPSIRADVFLLVQSALAMVSVASAQTAVPEVRLGRAERTLPHQFTQIRAVRELSSGPVIVTDRLEPAIYSADWASGRLKSTKAISG